MVAGAGDGVVVGLLDLVLESTSVVASAASFSEAGLVLAATFELRTAVRDAPPAAVDDERVGKGPLKRLPVWPSGKR